MYDVGLSSLAPSLGRPGDLGCSRTSRCVSADADPRPFAPTGGEHVSDDGSREQWTELSAAEESDHEGSPPSGGPLDLTGYDRSDDPASTPVAEHHHVPLDGAPTSYPMQPAAIPTWVHEFGNGAIPLDRLIKVAPTYNGYLTPEAAAAWRSLQIAAQSAGWNLTMTGAYRTYDEQVAMFTERFITTDTGRSSKVWNGTTYWLKPNVAMAATPGSSNHGWACAVDMALGGYAKQARNVATDPAFLEWAVGNAAAYGWSWEVQSEPWHVRLVSPSARGIAAPMSTGIPRPTLRFGSNGGQVAALQTLCTAMGWGNAGRPDGVFGERTKAAVQAMQQALAITADGIYGPVTAAALEARAKDV
jgi:peptidoglycan hydrolase-like protein with peptidoglycan-binding domain